MRCLVASEPHFFAIHILVLYRDLPTRILSIRIKLLFYMPHNNKIIYIISRVLMQPYKLIPNVLNVDFMIRKLPINSHKLPFKILLQSRQPLSFIKRQFFSFLRYTIRNWNITIINHLVNSDIKVEILDTYL